MKKFLITCFYLTLTLAVCAGGFLFPSTLNAYQDRQIFSKIEHTAMDPPSLTYSSSLYDTLLLLSSDHYFVDYPSTGNNRSREEVQKIAMDFIEQLVSHGIIDKDSVKNVSSYISTLQLAIASEDASGDVLIDVENIKDATISKDTDGKTRDIDVQKKASLEITTAVVWSCSITYDSSCYISLSIDDKSGKAVGLSISSAQILNLTLSDSELELDAFAASIADFYKNYYELKAKPIQHAIVRRISTTMFEKDGSLLEASYTIQLEKDDGTKLPMPLWIYSDHMSIN